MLAPKIAKTTLHVGRQRSVQTAHNRVQLTVLRQYKDLLVQAKYLFDENAKKYVAERIRQRFRDNSKPQGLQRLHKNMKDGRRWLSILERSNLGDIKAIEVVLDHTYARRGRRKHEILDALTQDKRQSPRLDRWRTFIAKEKNVDPAELDAQLLRYSEFKNRHGKPRPPPEISPAVLELMKKDPYVDQTFKPPAQSPYQDHVPRKRLWRAMWKHYKVARRNLGAPLPLEEVQFLVRMAIQGPEKAYVRTEFLKKIEARRKAERQATGKFRGRFHTMDQNFLKRRYQDLLKRCHIPVLEQVEEGRWKVTSAASMLPVLYTKNIPNMDPRHKEGFFTKGGKKISKVDSQGLPVKS